MPIKKILVFLILFISTISIAQRPREIQLSDEPIIWSDPWSIAFYIVLPVFLIVTGIILARKFKKKKNSKD